MCLLLETVDKLVFLKKQKIYIEGNLILILSILFLVYIKIFFGLDEVPNQQFTQLCMFLILFKYSSKTFEILVLQLLSCSNVSSSEVTASQVSLKMHLLELKYC